MSKTKVTNAGATPVKVLKAATEKKKQKPDDDLCDVPKMAAVKLYGLQNQGATSYLNSVLQVLFMTPGIHGRLDPKSQTMDKELRNLFEKLRETSCGTENITKSLRIQNVHQQRDAADCLQMILHKVSPQVSEVFQGELRYITRCSKGHIISEVSKPFSVLPLTLRDTHESNYSMEREFGRVFEWEIFTEDKKMYCSKCEDRTKATSRWEMVKTPQILILHLKRFDLSIKPHDKSDLSVNVPRELQIKEKTYRLYGMVDHIDSLRDGHYTATVRSNEDNTWYKCKDDNVEKVEEQPFANSRLYKSKTAYLLMYRATGPQMSSATKSGGLTDNALQKQDDASETDSPGRDDEQEKSNHEESDDDDEERGQMRHRDVVTQPQTHYGLRNQGATCYLNSVLQVLFMTPEIHDRLDPETGLIDPELRKLFEKLKVRTCGTEKITKTLGIQNVHQQNDAAECLATILRHVSPQVSEVLQGELEYVTKCSRDHIINEETNPFWTLPLPLKDVQSTAYSVEKGVKGVLATKSYSGHSMVFCNDCEEKRDATCACKMVKLPRILILLLKRFDFDHSTMSHVKSNCCVDIPPTLQIQDKTYQLYGMVDHMGSLKFGHYTATIMSNEDKKWYEFDDTRVTKVEEKPFTRSRDYKSDTAYLLIYRAAESQTSSEDKLEVLTDSAQQKQDGAMTWPQKLYGLKNQGATCYLNSILQALFKTSEIPDRLYPKSQTMDQELRNLFEKLRETSCGTENITKSLQIQNVHQQRDAADCLQMILHKVSPQVSEVFQGELRYTTRCSKGHIISEVSKPFSVLPLTLRDTQSVEKIFEKIFKQKSSNKKVHCVICQTCKEAKSRWKMVKTPQILILHLKRFDLSVKPHDKSDLSVNVPRELQIEEKTYRLYGMVDHIDSLRDGHYTATVRSNEDNTWYECKDNNAQKIEGPFAKNKPYKSKTAYLLVYAAAEAQTSSEAKVEVRTDNAQQEQDDANVVKDNPGAGVPEGASGPARADGAEETLRPNGHSELLGIAQEKTNSAAWETEVHDPPRKRENSKPSYEQVRDEETEMEQREKKPEEEVTTEL